MLNKKVILILLFIMFLMNHTFGEDNNLYSIGMGLAGIGNETELAESRIEYRFNKKYLIFSPIVGMMVMGDGSKYFYGGVNLSRYFGNSFIVTPNFAIGGFHNGGEKNLGGIIEFRSGLEIGYWIYKKLMVGVAFHHISNASIYKRNPGTETLSLILTIGSRPQKKVSEKCYEGS